MISTRALPSGYTTGYLQICLHWVVSKMFRVYLILPVIHLSTGRYLVGTLGVFTNLVSLGKLNS